MGVKAADRLCKVLETQEGTADKRLHADALRCAGEPRRQTAGWS